MRDIFVLLISAALIFAAFTSRFAGAFGYWWFSIFRPQDWVWGNINSLKLPLIALAVFVIPCFLQGLWPRIKDSISFLMLAWLGLAFTAAVATNCTPIGFRQDLLFQFSIMMLAIFLTIRVTDTPKKFYLIVAIVAASIAFHSGKAGLLSLLGMGGSYYGASTLTGLFAGSNSFAFGSAVLLFFNIFIVKMAHTKNAITYLPSKLQSKRLIKAIKFFGPIVAIGMIYNVIALFSRGAALAMFIGLVIWFALSKLLKFKHVIMTTTSLVLLFSLFGLPEGYEERIVSAFAEEEELDVSAASRPHFWGIAADIARDQPLGVGPGCYNTYYEIYDHSNGRFGHYRTVHSAHFEALAETGYMGVIVWLLLYIIALKKLFSIRKLANANILHDPKNEFFANAANMLITANIVFFIGSAFYAQAYNDIIWLIWGLTVILVNLFEQKQLDDQTYVNKGLS
jgi:O-antigen ligase